MGFIKKTVPGSVGRRRPQPAAQSVAAMRRGPGATGGPVPARGGAESDILMKPGSECSEKPVLPGFRRKIKHKNPKTRIYAVFRRKKEYSKPKIRVLWFINNTDPTPSTCCGCGAAASRSFPGPSPPPWTPLFPLSCPPPSWEWCCRPLWRRRQTCPGGNCIKIGLPGGNCIKIK